MLLVASSDRNKPSTVHIHTKTHAIDGVGEYAWTPYLDRITRSFGNDRQLDRLSVGKPWVHKYCVVKTITCSTGHSS